MNEKSKLVALGVISRIFRLSRPASAWRFQRQSSGSNPGAPTKLPFYPRTAVFISQNIKAVVRWSLASVALADAWTDFILSRQAMNVAPSTLAFYHYTGRMGIGSSLLYLLRNILGVK